MNKYLSLLVIQFGLLAIANCQTEFEDGSEDIFCHERARSLALVETQQFRNYAADQTDIVYQEMHWEVDPAVVYIKGVITYYFKSKVDQLDQLVLDLATPMHVTYIRRGSADLSYMHSSDKLLSITLGKILSIGEMDTLTIAYEGEPVSTGLGSFVQVTHNGKPLIETESVPYGVRDWWPGKQDLIDKVDSVDIYITTPPGQLAASIGKLISITEDNGKLIHHWKHRHPIVSYLIAMAVTNYTAFEDKVELPGGDSLQILNYVYPESINQAMASNENTRQIMEFYNEKFGLYPYADEKYGHAQWSSGGTEIQTMSFMVNFSYDLIAHEMAHQWFGDKVTEGSYRDVWLSEGFATYLQGMTVEEFFPENWKSWLKAKITSVAGQSGGSVYVEDTTNVARIFSGRLSYNKAAYLLHMLRWEMGDTAFLTACRNYLESPGTAYEFARTADLQYFFEQASGLDLDEFFADWYYGQGYPSYDIEWYQYNYYLYGWIHQTQSHPSVSFFEMPIPLWAYHDGIPVKVVIGNVVQDQEIWQNIGFNIDSLVFDPELWILSVNNKVHQTLGATKDIIDSPEVIVFPNPANDQFKIKGNTEVTDVILTSALGIRFEKTCNEGNVNVADMPEGLYFLQLESNHGEIISHAPLLILR